MAPKEKRERKGKAAKADKERPPSALSTASDDTLASSVSALSLDNEASNRTSAGVLTSHRDSRDIKIEQYSLSFYSQILLQDTTIELNYGRRYGLIGANGCGWYLN